MYVFCGQIRKHIYSFKLEECALPSVMNLCVFGNSLVQIPLDCMVKSKYLYMKITSLTFLYK